MTQLSSVSTRGHIVSSRDVKEWSERNQIADGVGMINKITFEMLPNLLECRSRPCKRLMSGAVRFGFSYAQVSNIRGVEEIGIWKREKRIREKSIYI